MANTILTPTIIAREALMQLRNNLVMGANVHRDYKKEFVKIGESVTIRKPVKFTVSTGATRVNQDVTENSTSITIDQRKHVSWKFSTQELTMKIEEYSRRYIEPACIVLANQVDVDLCGLYNELWTSSGTAGTTPATFASLGTMAEKLDDVAVPDDGMRKLILNPAARWSMADALKGIYDNSMPNDFVRKGLLGRLANFYIFGDQNVSRHTNGTFAGTTLINDASPAEGDAAVAMDGFGNSMTGAVAKGDVFTVAGVNAVNPISKTDLGYLQQFVVTATANSDGSGDIASVAFQPELRSTGAYQTVSALWADNAAVTFRGTSAAIYPQNLAFHKNALALVMCPLELPDSAGWKARVNMDGISIRVLKDYDIAADEEIIRLDIFYGTKAIYPELGGRLWG